MHIFVSQLLLMHASTCTLETHVHSHTNISVTTYMLRRDRADSTALFLPSQKTDCGYLPWGHLLADAQTQFRTNTCTLSERWEKQLLCHHSTAAPMGFMCRDRPERFGADDWIDWKYQCLCCSPPTPRTHVFGACLSINKELRS